MSTLNIVLQVLGAIVVVIILYLVTLAVLSIDSLTAQTSFIVKPREQSMVVDGYANVANLANRQFNTVNPFAGSYVKMPRSLNTMGGAQFTYQFWIKITEPNDDNFKDLVLFVKGDNTKYKIGTYPKFDNSTTNPNNRLIKEYPSDMYIRCPLIKFVSSWRHMKVQFNTTKNPLTEIDIRMNPDGDSTRRNILSLLPINWYLMTFVFEDNYSPLDSVENGIRMTFYLNDVPYQTNSASTENSLRHNYLKQNDGDFFVLPSPRVTGDFMHMGNLSYFNYAMNGDEVRKAFARGPPSQLAQFGTIRQHAPAYLTAYNKLDIYNM